LQDDPNCCYPERSRRSDFLEIKILGEMRNRSLRNKLRGKFIVLDGLDVCGKVQVLRLE
jgi:hypothetical protein